MASALIVVAIDMLPSPLTPLTVPVTSPVRVIDLLLAQAVAVLALPLNAAVIVPALKLPLESLRTIVLIVLALVAVVVAEFA